ncbi:hypothetical protein [Pseudomonas putida]|uniref:hypothetical protein n=1 Tax=Pseudomonas TaxID=286 RepID=UPI00346558B9
MFPSKMLEAFTSLRWFKTSVLLGALAGPLCGQAAETIISARYNGNASGEFENTTPAAAYCKMFPGRCVGYKLFTANLPITYDKQSVHGSPNPRQQFYIKAPARRTVRVTHDKGSDAYDLLFEITHLSQGLMNDPRFPGAANPVFTAYPQGGCNHVVATANGRASYYLWAVRSPANPTGCYSSGGGAGTVGDVHQNPVDALGVGYRLAMPSALRMKQGIYRGSLDFTIGPGGDIDPGEGVTNLSSPALRINFELDVQHAFVLNFPAASDRAVLEPPGGWSRWLGGGTPPSRLERSLRLNLWSTGPFKVYKMCQYDQGTSCGIRNGAGHQVPVDLALTLPSGVQHANAPVQRLTIPTGRDAALAFEMAMPVAGQAGQLHFDVISQHVKSMLDYPGSTYLGDVTVLFDATL